MVVRFVRRTHTYIYILLKSYSGCRLMTTTTRFHHHIRCTYVVYVLYNIICACARTRILIKNLLLRSRLVFFVVLPSFIWFLFFSFYLFTYMYIYIFLLEINNNYEPPLISLMRAIHYGRENVEGTAARCGPDRVSAATLEPVARARVCANVYIYIIHFCRK